MRKKLIECKTNRLGLLFIEMHVAIFCRNMSQKYIRSVYWFLQDMKELHHDKLKNFQKGLFVGQGFPLISV